MNLQLKKKIAFAMTIGITTTGIISFLLISINVGFKPNFAAIWLRSWLTSYLIAVPAIIVIGPKVQSIIDNFFDETVNN